MSGIPDQLLHATEPGARIPEIKIYADKFLHQVVLITGAANGIGEATSKLFAAQGANLALLDLNAAKLESLETELSKHRVDVECLTCDVNSEPDVNDAVAKVIKKFGKIDVLVRLAGIYPLIPINGTSYEEFRRFIKINLDSCFLFTRAVLPHMRAAGYGRTINTSSNSFQLAPPGLSAYIASKAGIIGFTRVTALEAGPGITANVIFPGLTVTGTTWQASLSPDGTRPMFDFMLARQAGNRYGLPNDIAHTISFVASPEAQFITAQQIDISGGATLYLMSRYRNIFTKAFNSQYCFVDYGLKYSTWLSGFPSCLCPDSEKKHHTRNRTEVVLHLRSWELLALNITTNYLFLSERDSSVMCLVG